MGHFWTQHSGSDIKNRTVVDTESESTVMTACLDGRHFTVRPVFSSTFTQTVYRVKMRRTGLSPVNYLRVVLTNQTYNVVSTK